MAKIRVGVAGLGRMGAMHARNIAQQIPSAEITAACSIVSAELAFAREALGVKDCFTDFDEMLEKADIDAVVIVTSTALHAPQAIKALKKGKHVFVEKPMGVDVAECLEIEKIVAEHPEQVFMMGFMRRYDPSYVYAKRKIEEGCIGKPYLVKATGIDPISSVPKVLEMEKYSSGLFVAMGVHDVDLIHWFLGSRANTVFATGGNYAFPEFADYNDIEVGCALYELENGTMGMLHTGRTAVHGYHIETEIIGTEGAIRISPVPQKNLAMIYGRDGVTQECVAEFRERFQQAFLAEMEEFFRCIETGCKPQLLASDGTSSTRVVLATKESFLKKQLIHIRH